MNNAVAVAEDIATGCHFNGNLQGGQEGDRRCDVFRETRLTDGGMGRTVSSGMRDFPINRGTGNPHLDQT